MQRRPMRAGESASFHFQVGFDVPAVGTRAQAQRSAGRRRFVEAPVPALSREYIRGHLLARELAAGGKREAQVRELDMGVAVVSQIEAQAAALRRLRAPL